MSSPTRYQIESLPKPLLTVVRESAGYSQDELAQKASMSRATISVAERGERCTPLVARALANVLGLPGDDTTIELLTSAAPRRWKLVIELVEEDHDGSA